ATPEHVRGTDDDRITEAVGDSARLAGRAGNAAVGLLQAELDDQLLEPVAVLGEVDGVRRGAEDRHACGFERAGKLQRRLAAELHDNALERALRLLRSD